MGVHAGQLALKSDLRLVQEYRRSLLPCLEQARRPTLDHHVYRSSGLGVWVLISENWYNAAVWKSTRHKRIAASAASTRAAGNPQAGLSSSLASCSGSTSGAGWCVNSRMSAVRAN